MSTQVDKRIIINASPSKIWDVLTNPAYARILGNEFDKNAYLQSDWKLGSHVYFKYESGKVVANGVITELKINSHIKVEYKEINYSDTYSLIANNGATNLAISSGPYPHDYEGQLSVWDRWLTKVKELSEA
jgi:hypothetical protein